MPIEEWRDVPDFPGYQVSNLGQVKGRRGSILRGVESGRHHSCRPLLVTLGHRKKVFVHHLVLVAFGFPRPDGMVCRHLNGNPQDNRLENLQWGTMSENQQDRFLHGTDSSGSKSPNAKLDDVWVTCIRTLHRYGWSDGEIAALSPVSTETIRRARVGVSWRNAARTAAASVTHRARCSSGWRPTRTEPASVSGTAM